MDCADPHPSRRDPRARARGGVGERDRVGARRRRRALSALASLLLVVAAADGATVTLVPNGDVSGVGNTISTWCDQSAGTANIYTAIDETIAATNDADYITSGANDPTAATYVFSMSDTPASAVTITQIQFNIRAKASGSKTVNLAVYFSTDGSDPSTSLSSANLTTSFATTAFYPWWSISLTKAQADALKVKLVASVSGSGSGTRPQVSVVECVVTYIDSTTWNNGAGTGFWGTAGNWTNGLPDATHAAVFDATSTANCSVNVNASTYGVDIRSGYTGGLGATISQANACSLTVGTNGWSQVAGTFTGASNGASTEAITIGGNYSQTGGTFTATRATTSVKGSFSNNGGTFNHNNGLVRLAPSNSYTLVNQNGSATPQPFYDLSVNDGSLLGYWRLDESASPAVDLSGNGNNATWQGSPTPSTTTLAPVAYADARSMPLSGSSQYLSIANPANFATNYVTVAGWCYHAGAWGATGPIFNYQAISTSIYTLEDAASNGFIAYMNGTPTSVSGLTAGKWYHVACTYDGTTNRLYIDGAQRSTASVSGTLLQPGGATASLGRVEYNLTGFLNATIDDVRVYNRALSAAEVATLASGTGLTTATVTLGHALTVAHDLSVATGSIDVSTSGWALTVGGSCRFTDGTLNARSGTITLNGATGGGIACDRNRFWNLSITGAGTWTLEDLLRVDNTLSVATGTLDVTTSNFGVRAGAISQGSGAITPRSGRVVVDASASQTLSVASSLNDLRIEPRLDRGLVGYWKMDQLRGSSVTDYSGLGHTGTIVGSPRWSNAVPSAPVFDDAGCFVFNGSTDYVTAPLPMAATDNWTLAAWVKPSALPQTNASIVYVGNDTGPGGYGFMIGGGQPVSGTDSSGSKLQGLFGGIAFVDSGYTFADTTTWHHVVMRRQSGTTSFWVDGTQTANTSATTPLGVGDAFQIGHQSLGNSTGYLRYFAGSIDDVRCYVRALGDSEIRNLANGRYANGVVTTAVPTESSLAAYWKLDDQAATTATDSSGNGLGSTLTNSSMWTTSAATTTFANAGGVSTDGSSTGVTLSGSTNLNFAANAAFTICLWFKSTDATGPILSLRNSASGNAVIDLCVGYDGLTTNSGKLEAVLRDSATSTSTGMEVLGSTVNDGAWHHVAYQRTVGGLLQLYLDGAYVGASTTAQTAAITTDLRRLGVEQAWINAGGYTADQEYLAASFDDVRVYTRLLSASEIAYLASGLYVDGSQTGITTSLGRALATTSFALDSGIFDANGSTNAVTNAFTLASGNGKYLASTANQSFGGFTISGSTFVGSSGSVTITGDFGQAKTVDANGSVAQDGGSFTAPSGTMSITGGFSHASGATYAHDNGLVQFNGGAAGKTITSGGCSFYDLSITGAGAWTASDALVVADAFDQSAGTFTAPSAMSVAGNFTHSAGTFTANGGTVTLNGTNQAISGSTTFANLTKTVASAATLTVAASTTQTITGTCTLQGASGQLLSLRSGAPGTQWSIDPQGTRAISYVDVQDSHNINATIINPANSTDSGDDTNWFPTAFTKYWIGAAGGLFATDTNWSLSSGGAANTVAPTASDTAIFDAGGNTNCSIGANASVKGVSITSGYTQTITPGAGVSVVVGASGWSQAGGTFAGGTGTVATTDVTLTGGTFTAPSSTLTLTGSFSDTVATFDGNGGTTQFTGTGSGHTIASGTATFASLNVNSSDGTGVWTLQDRLYASGTLTLAAGQLDVSASNYSIRCGTLNQTGAATTLVPRSGTVVMDSTGGGSIKAVTTLNALRIEGADETGLMAYWKFDRQAGASHSDWSGNSHTATAQSASTHSTSTPPATLFDNGGSATFNGSSDYLTVASSTGMNATSFTIAAWINPSSVSAIHHDIVSKWGTSGNESYNFRIDSSGVLVGDVSTDGSTDTFAAGATALTTSTWYHVALTYDGAALRVWLNGSLNGATAHTGNCFSSTEAVTVGHIDPAFASGRWFAGLMDDVRIYSRALSSSEIRNLANGRYANGSSGTPTWTLAANLATATLGIDAGVFNANGFTTSIGNAFTMRDGQGAYQAGSATQTFSGGLTMSGGTFTGGGGTVAIAGDFTMAATTDANGGMPQSGGTFTAPSGTMTVTGSIAMGGGTFAPNGGTVQLTGSAAGKTLTGVTASGGGLYGSYLDVDQIAVTADDWRSGYTIAGTRLDATLNWTSDAFGTATERAGFAIGGTDANWDSFSAQWDGWITVPVDGTWLKTRSDDGSRIWLDLDGDGAVRASEWGNNSWGTGQSSTTKTTQYQLPKGTYRIRVQYQESSIDNTMQLAWSDSLHSAGTTADGDYVVPSTYLTPALGGGLFFNNLQVTGSGSWTIAAPLSATGAITCSAGTLAQAASARISAASWSQAGGTFTGSSGATVDDDITLSGGFSCTSGTFTSTAASLNVGGDFTVSGTGTFTHNSGTLEMRPSATRTLTCTQALNHLRINDGLIAYWNFDDASSPAVDLTGRGHDAAWQGSPTPSTTTLPTLDVTNARAMPFNGTSQYLVPARQHEFASSTATIAAWAYVPSSASWAAGLALFNYRPFGGNELALVTNTNGYRLVLSGATLNTSSSVSTNAWHHVAGTYDGTTAKLFIDGYQVTSAAVASGITEARGATAAIGRNQTNLTNFFPGSLDEIRVYNRALSSGEIQRLGNLHDPGATLNTVALGSNLTLAGDVILLSGTLDASPGYDLTVGGNWTNRGGGFTAGARTVTMTSGSSVAIRSGNQAFNNLTLSGVGTFTASDQLRTTGDLLQSAGTFLAPSTRLVCGGNLTISGGTFTNDGGTVIMKSQAGSTLTCSQALNNVVFTDGLIAHWRFEETASPCVDVSGWNHNATWVVAPTSDAVVKPGLFCDNARSLTFDGANTYLQVTDGFEFQPASKLSVSCWVKTNASSNVDEGGIFGRMGDISIGATAVNRGYQMMSETTAGMLMMRVNDSAAVDWGNLQTTAGAVGTGAWHHLAFTLDGSNWTWYLDGAVNAAANYGAGTVINPADGIVWIGRNASYRYGYHPSLNGKLDDLRFYDRDLSASDVARLASGREPQTGVATFTLASNLTVNGNLTIGSGTLDLNSRAVAVAGNWRCEGKVAAGTSTVTLSGTGVSNTVLSGGQSLDNVVVGGTGTWTLSDWLRVGGTYTQSGATLAGNGKPITVGGDLALNGGTLQGPAAEILACGGAVGDNGGGTYQGNGGALELTSTSDRSLNLTSSANQLWVASGATTGLVARFRLDEAQAGKAIDDVSGVIATAANTPTASTSTPTLATNDPYCLDCSGAGSGGDEDYLRVATGSALDTIQDNDYSISAWFYPRALATAPAHTAIVSKPGYHIGLFYLNTGQFDMEHFDSSSADRGASSAATYPLNAWYHLLGVVDRTNGAVRLYVNGVLAAKTSFTAGDTIYAAPGYDSEPWYVGIGDPNNAGFLWPANGLVDDVRFYGRALGASEALALASGIDAADGTATFTLAHAADVNGDLDLIGGTLAAAGLQINAAAAWRNLVGTGGFTAGGGTVVLDGGDQSLYGSTTFANLTKSVASAATLTFPVYECQNVTGNLTLNGASGQLLSIRSSIAGSMATINPSSAGTRTCSFLDVKDSRNFTMPIINPGNSVDSGDTRWWFGGAKGNGVLIANPPVE